MLVRISKPLNKTHRLVMTLHADQWQGPDKMLRQIDKWALAIPDGVVMLERIPRLWGDGMAALGLSSHANIKGKSKRTSRSRRS